MEGRWLVLASVDPAVAAGDELTAVDGTPTTQLAARYCADTPDASVTPDVPVKRTFEAQAAGVDQELEAVRRLIGLEGR